MMIYQIIVIENIYDFDTKLILILNLTLPVLIGLNCLGRDYFYLKAEFPCRNLICVKDEKLLRTK